MAKRNADRARSCTEQRRKEEIAVGEVQRVTSRPHGWVRRALRSQDCCSAARLSPLLLRKLGILKNGIFSKGSSSAGKPEPKVDLSSGEQPACQAPAPAEVPRATVDGWGSCPGLGPASSLGLHLAIHLPLLPHHTMSAAHPGCPETKPDLLSTDPQMPSWPQFSIPAKVAAPNVLG